MGYISFSYIYIIIPPLIFSIVAQFLVKSRFSRYSKIASASGLTGAQAAETLLRENGIFNVKIERISGNLTDCYDPRINTIKLSQGVYDSNSISAIGVACHEAGHACQYANNYFPIKIRNAVIPVANIGTSIGIPLCLVGLLFGRTLGILFYIGIILYSAVFVFQLATLPVEFNASSRALKSINRLNLLQGDEYSGAKKVLTAAAMTYVAAMLSSLASVLRLLLIANRNRR